MVESIIWLVRSHFESARSIFNSGTLNYGVSAVRQFGHTVEYMAQKCTSRIPLLQGLARNTYGYSYRVRKVMLNGCITSFFTIGCT